MKKCACCNVKPGKDQLSNLLIVPPILLTMLFGTKPINVLVCKTCQDRNEAGTLDTEKLLNDNQ